MNINKWDFIKYNEGNGPMDRLMYKLKDMIIEGKELSTKQEAYVIRIWSENGFDYQLDRLKVLKGQGILK